RPGLAKTNFLARHVDRMHHALEGDEQPLIAVPRGLFGYRITARIEERLRVLAAGLVSIIVEPDAERRPVPAQGQKAARARRICQAASWRRDLPSEYPSLDIDDAQGRPRGPVEDGHEAIIIRQRLLPQRHGVRRSLGR